MAATGGTDPFGARRRLGLGPLEYLSLRRLDELGMGPTDRLPVTVRIWLEMLLRHAGGPHVSAADVEVTAAWSPRSDPGRELPFLPARVLLQDFTGVPLVVDLAAMRAAVVRAGGDPGLVDPRVPADLVVDHSVQVDAYGTAAAYGINLEREYERNHERYALLRWAQQAFRDFQVVPPGMGIVHQVNLEYLARVVRVQTDERGPLAVPDTVVGTDSHTTMVDGLGVLGFGVGGIEAEAVMLGQPLALTTPQVVGVQLHGRLGAGVTATDLVLHLTEWLRGHGVVGRFVEFCGTGLGSLTVADRATLANMAPEYGATAALFPVDDAVLAYLRLTGREEDLVELVERYTKEQGLFRTDASPVPEFTESLELDLATIEPSLAGPRRPQDRVPLAQVPASFRAAFPEVSTRGSARARRGTTIGDGAVVIAAITSCTNTSNPSVMLAAGLLAQRAVARGLRPPAHVKTSMAPGSRVVTDYLAEAGVLDSLAELGFEVVGYGCTTCIGNSGPLPEAVTAAIEADDLAVAAVLSGNRNFEGRIHREVRAAYLASPPLVVAYALAGSVLVDIAHDPLGTDRDGREVRLADLWPTPEEVATAVARSVQARFFTREYGRIFEGDDHWHAMASPTGPLFAWDAASTYVREPPFLQVGREPGPVADIEGARVLALLGDSVTTDHISPAGSIPATGPAGLWLQAHDVSEREFNSFGARRGNHEVMARGTFANVRLRNGLAGGREGGYAAHLPDGEVGTIHEVALRYQAEGTPLVVLAGREYGTGSSRDWAAKGPQLLGVRAVVAQSFERIHRSNLVGMGILPLEFRDGASWTSLGLTGRESYSVRGLATGLRPRGDLDLEVREDSGAVQLIPVRCRIDSAADLATYQQGGVLPLVLRQILSS